MARAVPLVLPCNIEWNEADNTITEVDNGKGDTIRFVEQGLKILDSVQGLVKILLIAGEYRTGKSAILTKVAGENELFELSNLMEAKTKGIWISEKVIKRYEMIDGKKQEVSIIFMDCEGIDDANTNSAKRENKIFTLGLLLPSYFIYNSKNIPASSDLEKLSFLVHLAKATLTQIKDDVKPFLPHFLWLLRDVNLQPSINKKLVSIQEYMQESILKEESNGDTLMEAKNRNSIRSTIRSYFSSIDAFELPTPSYDIDVLANINKVKDKELNPNFVKKRNELVHRILDTSTPKKGYRGVYLNGKDVSFLLQNFVNTLNQGYIPVIINSWTMLKDYYLLKSEEPCLKVYVDEMNKLINSHKPLYNIKELDNYHNTCSNIAINKFHEELKSFAGDYTTDAFQVKLEDKKRELEVGVSEKACDEYLTKLFSIIQGKIQTNPKYTEDLFEQDIILLAEQYQKAYLGSAKDSKWDSFQPEIVKEKGILRNLIKVRAERGKILQVMIEFLMTKKGQALLIPLIFVLKNPKFHMMLLVFLFSYVRNKFKF